jgi:hypothetical protein
MISPAWRTVDKGPVKNSPARMVRASRSTAEGDLGIAGYGDPGQFRGRVGMGKTAADGAALETDRGGFDQG